MATPLALIACITLVGPAVAHTLNTPRMVQVKVSADRVEVAVAWLIHAGPEAAHLRSRFDRNGDGTLSEPEQDLIAAWLQRRVERALRLTLDGLPLETEVGALDLILDRNRRAGEEGMQFGSRAAILLVPRPGTHELTIEDRPDLPMHSVPLRVDSAWPFTGNVSEGEALPLAARGPGILAGGGFTGSGGKITVRFEVPPGPPDPPSWDADAPPMPGSPQSENAAPAPAR